MLQTEVRYKYNQVQIAGDISIRYYNKQLKDAMSKFMHRHFRRVHTAAEDQEFWTVPDGFQFWLRGPDLDYKYGLILSYVNKMKKYDTLNASQGMHFSPTTTAVVKSTLKDLLIRWFSSDYLSEIRKFKIKQSDSVAKVVIHCKRPLAEVYEELQGCPVLVGVDEPFKYWLQKDFTEASLSGLRFFDVKTLNNVSIEFKVDFADHAAYKASITANDKRTNSIKLITETIANLDYYELQPIVHACVRINKEKAYQEMKNNLTS